MYKFLGGCTVRKSIRYSLFWSDDVEKELLKSLNKKFYPGHKMTNKMIFSGKLRNIRLVSFVNSYVLLI